jgi:hypothetical protein
VRNRGLVSRMRCSAQHEVRSGALLSRDRHRHRRSRFCSAPLRAALRPGHASSFNVDEADQGEPTVHADPTTVCRAAAYLAVSFQQIVHPVLTEETEVAEASDSEGKPDEHA